MADMFQLDGSASSLDLGGNFALRAPGVKGRVSVASTRPTGTRGPELATPALDDALRGAGIDEMRSIAIEGSATPPPPRAAALRGPGGEDAMELAVPDMGEAYGQVVLSVDEAGAMRWHFPMEDDQSIQPNATRGAGGVKRFLIPRDNAATPPDDGRPATRGLVGIIGRKVLKVLIYPLADAVLGPIEEGFAKLWERSKRPYGLRRFTLDDQKPLRATDWSRLSQGRALLFVHGTFSTARGAFAALPDQTMDALAERYGGRVFAFDHPSLHHDPDENVRWFFAQVPSGVTLDVDMIAHSRGGLVARCIAERAASLGGDAQRFRSGRIVHVGVPNNGTELADPDHVVDMIDRMTSALNLLPDGLVSDVLEAILAVVKVVGHAGLVRLDGLAAMNPGGDFLQRLNAVGGASSEYYAVTADFAPKGTALASLVGQTVADKVMDRVFEQQPNDLVVPTLGVFGANGDPSFPLAEARVLHFPADRGVMHTAYFGEPETQAKLLEWLG